MTQTIFAETVEIVKALVGNEYLYFDSKLEIKTSPHTPPMNAWAVCVSPKDELFVMDSDQQWHQVELADRNAAEVIGSLYQRVRLMKLQYAQQSNQ